MITKTTLVALFGDIIISGGMVGLCTGVTIYCHNKSKSEEEKERAKNILDAQQIFLEDINRLQNRDPQLHTELLREIEFYSNRF